MFAINVTGDKLTEANLARLAAGIGPMLGQALEVGMLPGANLAKQYAPYRTGNLRRSIHAAIVAITATSASGHIGTNLEYAEAQERGATIRPKNAKMLHWVDPATGEDVFARQVTIPPHPYMRPGLDTGWPLMVEQTGRAFGILLSKAAAL